MNDKKMNKEKRTFYQDYSNLMMEVSTMAKTEGNPFFKSKYVPLKDILSESKNVCLSNNFIFIQSPRIDNNKPVLLTKLIHKSGEIQWSKMPLVARDDNDPQKVGGALTYMRRYSLTAMLGIQEEDDDGNNASNNKSVTQSTPDTKIIQNPNVEEPF